MYSRIHCMLFILASAGAVQIPAAAQDEPSLDATLERAGWY